LIFWGALHFEKYGNILKRSFLNCVFSDNITKNATLFEAMRCVFYGKKICQSDEFEKIVVNLKKKHYLCSIQE